MKATIQFYQYFNQVLFLPVIALDINKEGNTLFVGWIFWSIDVQFGEPTL